jgi:RNA polymerase sigma-70 factor, ECF subfamily
MGDADLPDGMRDELRTAWHRYVDLLTPLRPALHGYCRKLTGNLWDAEDLVQDTLLHAFGALGHVHHQILNPRAYVFRVATNRWIDGVRRRAAEAAALAVQAADPGAATPEPRLVRDAAVALLQRLAPQERAALLLKESFDLSLDEIATVLSTSTGAVKSALHRGRERLREPQEGGAALRPAPSAELVDRFVKLYQARDKDGLVAMMLDAGQVENVGCSLEFGRDEFERDTGWFHHAVSGHPEWPPEFQYESARLVRALFEEEPIALGLVVRRGREALEQVLRFEECYGGIARLRGYAFCPETMREVGAALGLAVRTGLYRYPTPAPGRHWSSP